MKYLLIFTALYFSCSSKKNEQYFEKIEPDGSKETGYLIDDSILTGRHLYFYPNGQLMSEEFYKNGKLIGERKFYYDNGILKQKCSIQDDLIHGWCYNYDSIGILNAKNYFVNGSQMGDAYFFKRTGKIDQYIFVGFSGKPEKVIFYDEKGNILENTGEGFIKDTFYNLTQDSASLGILVSHPPFTRTDLVLYGLDSSKEVIDSIVFESQRPFLEIRRKVGGQIKFVRIISNQFDSALQKSLTEMHETAFD